MSTNINPSSRDFGHSVCGDAWDVLSWRTNLPDFFKVVTGDDPYPYQVTFLTDMQDVGPTKILVSAGRQLGKSKALSVLALWYAYVLPLSPDIGRPINVLILGGSFAQAKLTYEYVCEYIMKIPWLKKQLAAMPTFSPMGAEIEFADGSKIRALTASPKQVRGPHADLLLVDEAAEADEDLLKASFQMVIASPIARSILASTPHQAHKSSFLFLDYFSHPARYGFKAPVYIWSAEDCPNPNIQREYQQAKLYMDEGTRSIEFEGKPYAFAGKVFPLKQLRKCCEYKNLLPDPNGEEKYAGVDWGYSPAPTCLVIVQRIESKYRILFIDAYLQENFEDVLDKIEKIAKSYNVLKINTDSEDIGENQRLSGRGLNVYPVKFKSQKAWMQGYLRALVEQEKLEIDDERDDRLKQQMLAYSYQTTRDDDFVDALMLAVKEGMKEMKGERDPTEILSILKEINEVPLDEETKTLPYQERYMKPEEIITKDEIEQWKKEKENRDKFRTYLQEGCECGSKEYIHNGIEVICKQCKKKIVGELKNE